MKIEQKSMITEEFQEKIWIFRECPLSLRHLFFEKTEVKIKLIIVL